MSLDTDVIVPWLVFNITGQWCLLALLVTFAAAKHLPQRRNPFFINFILTTFLATIPPSLLLYTGNQYGKASNGLCFAQAALVDGVSPMFGVAQLVIVFDTWSELRNLRLNRSKIARRPILKYTLIIVPYLVLWIWTFSSFIAAAHSKASRYDGYVYCVMNSGPSIQIRNSGAWFMSILGLAEFFFLVWICWMIHRNRPQNQALPLAWGSKVHFTYRLLILSVLQLLVVGLVLLDIKLESLKVKFAYDLIISMNALTTFVVFGTQRNILQTWKFWEKKPEANFDESDPPGYSFPESPGLNTSKSSQFVGDSSDREEKV